METRKQATPVFTTLCVFIGVLVTVQLWLLSASVEAVLAGDVRPAIASTIASLVLFCACAGLLRYASVLDHRIGR